MEAPSRAWYWAGGAFAALAVGTAVLLVVTGFVQFVNRVDDFQRVPLGGEGTVVFERPGGYTLYYESRFSSDRGVPEFDVTLVADGGGDRVPLSEYGSDVTYDVGGHHGRALYSFRITEPGRYLLRAGSLDGREGGTSREKVAVGRGLGRGLLARISAAVVIGLFGFGGGAAIIIVTALRRHAIRTRPQPGPSSA